MKLHIPQRGLLKPKGFALVVTLTLMILLTIIAVGLLTLSSVSLRTAGQGEAMATARNNAKLALMLALGDLQKSLGPDKAVSATSEILSASPGKPNATGVWESWDFDPSKVDLNYTEEKKNRFRRWLVSTPNPNEVQDIAFSGNTWSPDPKATAVLVGKNGMGGLTDERTWSKAGKVPMIRNEKTLGAYAWHISDESVKARINLYRDPSRNSTWGQKRALLAGHRPITNVIQVDDKSLNFLPNDLTAASFGTSEADSAKITDIEQVALLNQTGNLPGTIKPFRNDVTPYSLGVMSNVRSGGLKQDLTSIFEMSNSATAVTLPAEFSAANKNRLYQSTHGITGSSDPYWSTLASYYNTFKSIATPETAPTFYHRPFEAVSPTTVEPPKRYYPGPVIAKVEALLSFVTRDSHAGWVASLKAVDPNMVYMGHLVYTPLITLHNPYNVNLSFDNLEVTLKNIPVAFNFYVNSKPQSSQTVPLSEMFVNARDRREKSFYMKIANWSAPGSSSTTGPIVMKPGQTLVCAPYLNPAASFSNVQGTPFFDYQNNLTGYDVNGNLTAAINAKPGYGGPCVGYDIDWLTPNHNGLSSGQQTDNNMGIFGLRANDRVEVEYTLQQPASATSNKAFDVIAKITSQGRTYEYGGLSFQYEDNATLKQFFPQTYRYQSFQAIEAYVPNTIGVASHARAKTVAIFSAYARTAGGGVYSNNSRNGGAGSTLRNGLLAGKPFLFHNPARTVVNMNFKKDKPGAHSHELNFQPFAAIGEVEDYFNLDATNRSNYLTGNTTQRGIKSGSYLELPTGPMQTIADFRRSNALTSSLLPNFVQPVGNSLVSPLMATDKVKATDNNLATYDLLDHSTLANHALYDRFYFSTFASVAGSTPDVAFDRFMSSSAPLPSQAFQPYLPAGKDITRAKTELFSGAKPTDGAYKTAAEYQLIRGAFNVNSTSVQAWKAMLAAMKESDVVTMWALNGALEAKKSPGTPILSMSMVNGGLKGSVNNGKIDDAETNEWNGYRELSDTELTELATRIVEQVRSRGPFLSMSDFVNRRIGTPSQQTEMGALEAALTEAKINDDFLKPYVVPITAPDIANTSMYPYKTPSVSLGNPAAGAPGWITQGDLLRILEPAATVRSDTFVIRVSGEARDPATQKVTAIAYAEAVVQRLPDYVDPTDRPSLNAYTDPSAAPANKLFGRRMSLVSFRWLSNEEV